MIACVLSKLGHVGGVNSDVSLYCLGLETLVGTEYGFWVGEGTEWDPSGQRLSFSGALVEVPGEPLGAQTAEPVILSRVLPSPCASLATREEDTVPRGV